MKKMIKLKLNNKNMIEKLVCQKLNKEILLMLNSNNLQVLLIQRKRQLKIIFNPKVKMRQKIVINWKKNMYKKSNFNILH